MRRTALVLLAAFVAPPLLAQDAELIGRFEDDQAATLALVEGLSDEQWNFKPAPDRWSIAEILEHVTVNEKIVLEVLSEELEDAEVTEASRSRAEAFESQVASTLRDRSQRFQAPDFLRPTGRWAGGDEVTGMFREVRAAMLRWLEEADFDLRTKTATNRILQTDLDAHAWALITVEHSARHRDQIAEVMEDEGFPAR